MSLVMGLDIGTSGARAVVVAADGRIVAEAKASLPPPVRDGAFVRQDPELWWQAAATAIAGIARSVPLREIAAVAVDGTSGTLLATDAEGRPLGPGRLYNDAGAIAAAVRIARLAPPESGAHGATSGLAKAMELAATPGVARLLHQADWIAGRLSGDFGVTDENNALKTGYDVITRAWPGWIAELGLDPGLLPRAVAPGTPVGRAVTAEAARLGFTPDTLIVAGTTDGCASFLATGADRPGDGVTALGTTLTLKLLSERPIFSPRHGVYSHRLGERWLAGGASNSGGSALLAHFSAEAMAALTPALDPAAPTGLDYYPLREPGERFPVADPALPPRVTPRPASDAVFLQGLFEGIARIEVEGYRLLEALGGPRLTRVLSVGGGARNEAWTAIRARVIGAPVSLAATDEAAYGAARLARWGIQATG